ncbi:MAG: TVP38/TMEM64 family protein [Spirochaetales bacterium]
MAGLENQASERDSTRGRDTVRVIVAVAVLAALLSVGYVLEVPAYLQQALRWVEGLGFWGPVLFAILYVAITVLLIPGSILTFGAGAVFGVVPGAIYTSVGATIGATFAFLLGRTLMRGWVEKRVSASPKLKAVDEAVEREGGRIVLLLRLSPLVPYNLSNYIYGLTKVRLGAYVLASWIGMLPGILLYAYIGSLVQRFAELGAAQQTTTTGEWIMYIVGLIATLIATVRITIVARRALAARVPDERSQNYEAEKENAEAIS